MRIKADTRETLGQSYATGDITIGLADGDGSGDGRGTIDAVANVGGKAAGMGEGVIVNVLTNLVKAFSANVERAVNEVARGRATSVAEELPAGADAAVDAAPAVAVAAVAGPSAPEPTGEDPAAIFTSLQSRFAGRLDVKLTTGPDDGPLLKATGQSFAMLHGGELVVRLYPGRCTDPVEAGKGELFVHDGRTLEDWLVVAGLDAAEWTAHTMEALFCAKD